MSQKLEQIKIYSLLLKNFNNFWNFPETTKPIIEIVMYAQLQKIPRKIKLTQQTIQLTMTK